MRGAMQIKLGRKDYDAGCDARTTIRVKLYDTFMFRQVIDVILWHFAYILR